MILGQYDLIIDYKNGGEKPKADGNVAKIEMDGRCGSFHNIFKRISHLLRGAQPLPMAFKSH